MSWLLLLLVFGLGFVVGASLMRQQRRYPPPPAKPRRVMPPLQEYAGLLAALSIPYTSRLLPQIEAETPMTVVFRHPAPKYPLHVMFVPKKDIRDVGDLSEEDNAYLTDLFACMTRFIREHRLDRYRIWSNGPGYQDVTYLHFHLGADKPDQG